MPLSTPVADDAYDPWDWDDLDPSPDIKHEDHREVLRGWVKAYRRECFELRATLDLLRGDIENELNGKGTPPNRELLYILLYPEQSRIEEVAAWQRKQAKKQPASSPNGDRSHA